MKQKNLDKYILSLLDENIINKNNKLKSCICYFDKHLINNEYKKRRTFKDLLLHCQNDFNKNVTDKMLMETLIKYQITCYYCQDVNKIVFFYYNLGTKANNHYKCFANKELYEYMFLNTQDDNIISNCKYLFKLYDSIEIKEVIEVEKDKENFSYMFRM